MQTKTWLILIFLQLFFILKNCHWWRHCRRNLDLEKLRLSVGSWSVEWEELLEEESSSGRQLARPKPWTVTSSELRLPTRKGSSVLHFCTLPANWNHSTIFQVPKDCQSSATYGDTCLVSEKFKGIQNLIVINFLVNICNRRIFLWATLSNGFKKIWTIRSLG